jgi:hypothetical protein
LAIPESSAIGKKSGTDVPGLGLTNGQVLFSDIVRNSWYYSNPDGSPRAPNVRPVSLDKAYSSIVVIEDTVTKQRCVGTRTAEQDAAGVWRIWILTASHCFVENSPFGMRVSGPEKARSLKVFRFQPYLQPGSAINIYWTDIFRLYRIEDTATAKVVSPQRVQRLGAGDVTKFLVEENVTAAEVQSSTMPICATTADESAAPVFGGVRGKVLVGPFVDPMNGLFKTTVLISHHIFGNSTLPSPWNANPSLLNMVANSSIELGASAKFDHLTAAGKISAGSIPGPMANTSNNEIYSFSEYRMNSGVASGDSGLPIFESDGPSHSATGFRCISGVVIREYWNNPNGSAGGMSSGIVRRMTGLGAGLQPTIIVHRVLEQQFKENWVQVFPEVTVNKLVAKVSQWVEVTKAAVLTHKNGDVRVDANSIIRPMVSTTLPVEANPVRTLYKSFGKTYTRQFTVANRRVVTQSFNAMNDVSLNGLTDLEFNGCLKLLSSFSEIPLQIRVQCSRDGVPLLEFDLLPNTKRDYTN